MGEATNGDGDEVLDVEAVRRELSEDQAKEQFLECARYGELSNLRLIVEAFPALKVKDLADEYGTSPLHMACANGHAAVVLWLLQLGASVRKNDSGNSPLHWAIQNKQESVVKVLVARAKDLDVLERNGMGKTSVTMAYDTDNVEILKCILEHSSAAKLNKDGSVAKKGEPSDLEKEEVDPCSTESTLEQTMTSVLLLSDEKIPVREIGFEDQKGDDLQTTGAFMWAASLLLANWIVDLKDEFVGKKVIELGAGCAVPGIVAHKCTQAKEVLVTDIQSTTWNNTLHNVDINKGGGGGIDARVLDWCKEETWPASLSSFDVVIGSDLVYDLNLVTPLLDVISKMPIAVFYYVTAATDRAGCAEFIAALEKLGFSKTVQDPPSKYSQDPFEEKNAEKFAIRFPEFDQTSFKLYKFSR